MYNIITKDVHFNSLPQFFPSLCTVELEIETIDPYVIEIRDSDLFDQARMVIIPSLCQNTQFNYGARRNLPSFMIFNQENATF